MNAVTHLEKVIVGEVSAVTHLEKVIAGETSAVTYTEKVITGEAPPITHLQKVIAGVESPVTHLEYIWAGGTPSPTEHEYTGAVPYTFTANGSPLISWRISGNTVQSSTPTPDNPIMPDGTGERTGNLFSETLTNGYTLNGTTGLQSTYPRRCATLTPVMLDNINSITLSYKASLNRTRCIYSILNGDTLISRVTAVFSNTTIDVSTADRIYLCFYDTADTETVTANDVSEIMIVEGSTAPTSYIPYGYKIPISSANTTTPIYLGEVQTTRRVKKLVLTGNENVSKDTGQDPTLYFLRYKHIQINSYCTHLRSVSTKPQSGEFSTVAQYDEYIFMNFGADIMNAQQSGNTVEGFKEYLAAQYAAGTPVTVWYVLATEETAVVNEPLMKIGNYADEVSNVATIPTNNGSTTIDVDTTVKPSEIYIKYKGA